MARNNLGILQVKFNYDDFTNDEITLEQAKEKKLDGLVELIETNRNCSKLIYFDYEDGYIKGFATKIGNIYRLCVPAYHSGETLDALVMIELDINDDVVTFTYNEI